MHSDAAQALARALAQFGPELAQDPQRCRAVLNDWVPTRKREVRILHTAAVDGVPQELAKRHSGVPESVLVESLAKRLYNGHGVDMELARWGVQAWADALSGGRVGAASRKQLPKPAPTPAAQPAPTPTKPTAPKAPVPVRATPPARPRPPAPPAPTSSNTGSVLKVMGILFMLVVLAVGLGAWALVKLMSGGPTRVAHRDSSMQNPSTQNRGPDPNLYYSEVEPEPAPDRATFEAEPPPVVPPAAPEPPKPSPPSPEVVAYNATLVSLVEAAGDVRKLERDGIDRARALGATLDAVNADLRDRRRLLGYLERAYQRAVDEQRWPMKASGYTYTQPNARRAIDALKDHIGAQEKAAATLDGLIRTVESIRGRCDGVVARLECGAGVSSDPDCPGAVLSVAEAQPLLKLARDLQQEFAATQGREPPISTLDLSTIPQP